MEHRHLPLLVVQLPQGTAFLLSSQLDSAVKCCSSEVLVSSGDLVKLHTMFRASLPRNPWRVNWFYLPQ